MKQPLVSKSRAPRQLLGVWGVAAVAPTDSIPPSATLWGRAGVPKGLQVQEPLGLLLP